MSTITAQITGGRMRSRVAIALLLALALTGLAAPAFAQLNRVGPVDPANGFPRWYQDKTGITLDLCLPQTDAELAGGYCLILPADVPNPSSLPETFPSNWAGEHFYWAGDAAIVETVDGEAVDALLVLALESTFAAEDPIPGDQIVFGRVRIRIDDVPWSGSYRVITPFGVWSFPNVSAGDRISFTQDLGFNCPAGQFDCALNSNVWPFLLPSTTRGGSEMPPHFANSRYYIADPARSGPVTGAQNRFSGDKAILDWDGVQIDPNVFRIEVVEPDGTRHLTETTDFTLMGRLFDGAVPGEVSSTRATYRLDGADTSRLDVFATAFPPLLPRLPGGIPSATPIPPTLSFFLTPCAELTGGASGNPGGDKIPLVKDASDPHFWAQAILPLAAQEDRVCFEDTTPRNAQGQVVPNYFNVPITDLVRVTQAMFHPGTGILTVSAYSSDPRAALRVGEFDGAMIAGLFTRVVTAPPGKVTVNSQFGGSAELRVTTGIDAPPPPPPVCTPALSVTTLDVAADAGSGSINLTMTDASCGWSARSSDASWLTITPASGSGSASLTYEVTANTAPTPRSASLTIAGLTVTVTQAAATVANPCASTVSPSALSFASTGGVQTIDLTMADAGCAWTAETQPAASWIGISPASGSGPLTGIQVTAQANTALTSRTATLVIAGSTVSITQDAAPAPACGYVVQPTSLSLAAAGGTGSFSVTVSGDAGCGLSASSSAAWISVTASAVSNGIATVTYNAAANTEFTQRTATLTIGTVNVPVTQAAAQQPPVAANDAATTPEEVPVTVNVLANDTIIAAAGAVIAVEIVASPGLGSAVVNANNTITFTPRLDAAGGDLFTYRVGVNGTFSQPANVGITITPVNDAPVARDDAADAVVNVPTAIAVLANDSDVDSPTLTVGTVVQTSGPAPATVTASTAAITVLATAAGVYTFAYTATDGIVQSNEATLTVNVSANPETITITQAQYRIRQARWTVSGTDSLRNGQILSVFYRTPADILAGVDGVLVGTAQVAVNNGAWTLDVRGNGVVPATGGQVLVRNLETGALATSGITIRN